MYGIPFAFLIHRYARTYVLSCDPCGQYKLKVNYLEKYNIDIFPGTYREKEKSLCIHPCLIHSFTPPSNVTSAGSIALFVWFICKLSTKMRAVPSVFSIKLFLWFISELFNKKNGINSSSESASELCQTAGKQRVSSQVCVLLITFVYYFFLLLILLSAKWKNTSQVADGSKSYQPATGKASVQCLHERQNKQTNEHPSISCRYPFPENTDVRDTRHIIIHKFG